MFNIIEVTGWRSGFLGSFTSPLKLLVWAPSAAAAIEIALLHWEQQRHSGLTPKSCAWDQMSIARATQQNPAAYGYRVTEIINIPMEKVQLAWDSSKVAQCNRTRRPVYLYV